MYSHAKRILHLLLSFLGVPGDIQLLFTMVAGSGMFGLVMSWLSWAKDEPYLAILIGLGCTAFMLNILIAVIILRRFFRVYESLVVEKIEPLNGRIDRHTKLLHVPLKVRLRNTLRRRLFVNFRRFEVVLQGKTNKTAPRNLLKGTMSPLGEMEFRLASPDDIDTSKPVTGSIELEIEYGANRESFPYFYRYVFNVIMQFPSGLDYQSDEKTVQMVLDGHLEEAEHYKKGWL